MSEKNELVKLNSKGFATAHIKGSPTMWHLKKPGEHAALCGKEPGQPSRHSSHKNRTGWRVSIHGREPTCEKCIAAHASLPEIAND